MGNTPGPKLKNKMAAVAGEVWPAQGLSPGPKFKKGCNGPRGEKPRTQTQKQDGVDGPKLKNKMASMGPNSKTRWRRS